MENAGFEMGAVEDQDPSKDTKLQVAEEPRDQDGYEDLDDGGDGGNMLGKGVLFCRSFLVKLVTSNKRLAKILFAAALLVAYNAYLIGAIWYNTDKIGHIEYCNDVGFLIIVTAVVYWCFLYYFFIKKFLGKKIVAALAPLHKKLASSKWTGLGFGAAALAAIVAYIAIDAKGNSQRYISACGIVVIVLFGTLVSKHPGRIIWSQVFWGLGLQFCMGLIILRWPTGNKIFDCISGKVSGFLDYTDNGSSFVYGYLTQNLEIDGTPLPRVFAFGALSIIFFFGFTIALLYHIGAMMWVISKLGWFLQITIGTTAAESMNAAANIFIGQTEAPILIKPFLGVMTKSELHAVMTGGFATIAGSVLGAYIAFGVDPLYLLSASIMAAPAALAMSKLIYPETKKSKTTAEQLKSISLRTSDGNALDAASQGASQGVMLIGNIIANLVAFVAFVAFINATMAWFGSLVGFNELSFDWLLSKIFIPFAYILGIDSEETEDVALLFGLKTAVNEFVAYEKLTEMKHLSPRSRAIATYALCSFANFSSIGIQLGGLGFMAPERRKELAGIVWFAFIAGTACGLLNACIAGVLLDLPGYGQMAALALQNATTAATILLFSAEVMYKKMSTETSLVGPQHV